MLPLIFACAISQAEPTDTDIAAQFPATTRLVIKLNFNTIRDAAFVKRNGTSVKGLFDDWARATENLGLDHSKLDNVWLALGDGYPQNTAIIIQGKIDPTKVHAKMQQHIRERRYSVGPIPIDGSTCYSMETPIGLNPLPGLSSTIIVGVRKDSIAISFDREGLDTILKLPSEKSAAERFKPFRDVLNARSALTCVAIPAEPLTAPDALMAGIMHVVATADLGENLVVQVRIYATVNEMFQNRLAQGGEQAEQIFSPIAQQQGLNPRLIRLIHGLISSRKIVAEGDSVAINMELSGQDLAKALQK